MLQQLNSAQFLYYFSCFFFFCQSSFLTRPRPRKVVMDLIIRTKQAVRALDNMNYKRMIKILGNEPNNEDTVSESSDAGGESDGIKDMV